MVSMPLSSEDVSMTRALVKTTLGLTYDSGEIKACFARAGKRYAAGDYDSLGEDLLAGGEGFGIKCYVRASGNITKASLWIFAPD